MNDPLEFRNAPPSFSSFAPRPRHRKRVHARGRPAKCVVKSSHTLITVLRNNVLPVVVRTRVATLRLKFPQTNCAVRTHIMLLFSTSIVTSVTMTTRLQVTTTRVHIKLQYHVYTSLRRPKRLAATHAATVECVLHFKHEIKGENYLSLIGRSTLG